MLFALGLFIPLNLCFCCEAVLEVKVMSLLSPGQVVCTDMAQTH